MRVYVIAIDDSESTFNDVIRHAQSWAEITETPITFDEAETLVGRVENCTFHDDGFLTTFSE